METYDRIKELRKKDLKLTQAEFGERLGVSRSVIKNIELNALARPDQKLSLYKLICNEFNVREEWLLNGIEPKFVQPDMFSLDEFIKVRGGTELELEIVKIYFELDPELRKALLSHFRSRLSELHPAALAPDTPEELEDMCPPIEEPKQDIG
ncbi:MAG: helix-turn-helix domain-containing protein [Lachnospiraceae bacterium]